MCGVSGDRVHRTPPLPYSLEWTQGTITSTLKIAGSANRSTSSTMPSPSPMLPRSTWKNSGGPIGPSTTWGATTGVDTHSASGWRLASWRSRSPLAPSSAPVGHDAGRHLAAVVNHDDVDHHDDAACCGSSGELGTRGGNLRRVDTDLRNHRAPGLALLGADHGNGIVDHVVRGNGAGAWRGNHSTHRGGFGLHWLAEWCSNPPQRSAHQAADLGLTDGADLHGAGPELDHLNGPVGNHYDLAEQRPHGLRVELPIPTQAQMNAKTCASSAQIS